MIPRLVIAAATSGAGKTTVASGLIGALRARGSVVQGFKVGPDYIDPSYHALASSRPGRNLDAFLSGPDLIAPLFRHGSQGAELAVIEGVMGLFDGASGRGELASTAHVAKLLEAPVVLVVDGSAMARSAAALIHGFRSFDPRLNVAGVIFNRVGSDTHEQLLREAAAAVPGEALQVLGVLRRDPRLSAPERHLGLTPVVERAPRARESLASLSAAVAAQVDLDAVLALARSARELPGERWSPEQGTQVAARIAIAHGPAFSFHYEENLELLTAAGAELMPFDPTVDETLPEGTGGLILAGGFPEVYGAELAANSSLRAEVAELAAAGAPILAECGGLLYLVRELDENPMCGVLPLTARMTERLTLGYREATAATATPWLAADTRLRGHEFHYTQVEPATGQAPTHAWRVSARGKTRLDGAVAGGVQAGYLHVHWAAYPQIPAAFVVAAARASRTVSA